MAAPDVEGQRCWPTGMRSDGLVILPLDCLQLCQGCCGRGGGGCCSGCCGVAAAAAARSSAARRRVEDDDDASDSTLERSYDKSLTSAATRAAPADSVDNDGVPNVDGFDAALMAPRAERYSFAAEAFDRRKYRR